MVPKSIEGPGGLGGDRFAWDNPRSAPRRRPGANRGIAVPRLSDYEAKSSSQNAGDRLDHPVEVAGGGERLRGAYVRVSVRDQPAVTA